MTEQSQITPARPGAPFSDADITAKGEPRAKVALERLDTLWFNTGTLCNIECIDCYIESSPTNDRLVYLTLDEMKAYLDEIERDGLNTREIAFTGGEPFMNPDMNAMAEEALSRGYEVLILTNAMRPMMRPRVQDPLAALIVGYGDKLTLRISLDHHSAEAHDRLRGKDAFERSLEGMRWLKSKGARLAVAGRTIFGESDAASRAGYATLFEAEGFDIDAANPGMCVLFPEMDEKVSTPEITTACWVILDKSPSAVMCSSSRMVVKRKGAAKPAIIACTLLPYSPDFELGETLAAANRPVALNHPHCSKFCVLGGASCSA